MNDETIRLILDLASSSRDTTELSNRLRELKTTTETTGDSVDKLERKTEQLGKTGVKTGQSLLQGGRVIQDFAQGGLGGILNNIEGLTMALGLGSGLAGILTVLGVVALVAGPAIKSFFQGLADGSNLVPKSTDAVERMTEALKSNKDALDELRKKQSLTNTELATYNKLTGENIGLEKELTAAKKARKVAEELMALRKVGDAEEDKERAANLSAEVGGKQSQVVGEVAQGMKNREAKNIEQELEKVWPAGKAWGDLTPENQRRHQELTKRQAEHQRGMPADITGRAQSAVGRAVVEGNEASTRFVKGMLPPDSKFRGAFERGLPENVLAQDKADEDFQQGLDDRSGAVKHRNASAKKKAAADKRQADADASTDDDASEGVLMIRKKNREDRAKIQKDQQEQAEQRGKRDERLTKNLGPGFIADAQSRMLSLDPRDKVGRADLSNTIHGQATKKLMSEGTGRMEAMAGANRAEGMMRGDLGRKLDSMGGRGQGNQQQLFGLLQQVLGTQGQQNGLTGQQIQQLTQMAKQNSAGLAQNRSNASSGAN